MSGYNQYASIGHETVWGTEVPRTDFFRAYDDSVITPNKPRDPVEYLGHRDPDLTFDKLESGSGTLTIPLTYNNGIELLMYHALGEYVLTGGGPPHPHVFTVDNNPFSRSTTPLIGLSYELNYQLPETGFEALLLTGGRVQSASGSIVAGEEAKATFEMIGKQVIAEPLTGTPTFPDYAGNDMVKWSQVTMKIDTVATTIYNLDWNIANNLKADRGILGSAFIAEPRATGRRTITGSLSKEWANKDILNDWLAGTAAVLEATAAGPGNFKIVYLWNNVIYTGDSPQLAEAEEQEQTAPWMALRDATNTAMKVTITNEDAAPFTA